MRVLFVLILIVIAVASLGLHRGWFHIGTQSGTDSSKVTFTLDKDKVQQDTTGATARPTTQTIARP